MDDNIPDSELLVRLAVDINHTLLSPNMDGNITDPDFLALLSGDINHTL